VPELNPFAVMMGILNAAASAARQPNSAGGPMDWPAWLSAVGTVGTFIVALVILGIRRANGELRRLERA